MGSLTRSAGEASSRGRGRRTWGALAVTALMASVLVVVAQPSGAATSTKSLTSSCTGADKATTDALSAFGGSVSAPITATTDAPAFVEPDQTGVPVKVTFSLSLTPDLVDKVVAVSPTLKVSNANIPIQVSGPTSTTSFVGKPAPQTITLQKGTALNAAFPTINGTLNDIGSGGIIKLSSQSFTFTITLAGNLIDPLNLKCTTGSTLIGIPVKVAGSPDIVQPIEIASNEGEGVSVDVLSDYVTNGRTKDGVEQQVDPSTLKIVEGDAQIVDGKIVSTGPAAGTSADVTFEVCAGTIEVAAADPGTSEVQELRIYSDPNTIAGKREIGARFAFGDPVEVEGVDAPVQPSGDVLWSAKHARGPLGLPIPAPYPNGTTGYPGQFLTGPAPANWTDNVNTYAFQSDFAYPTAAMVQTALESIPSIGPGNVSVTQGDIVSNGAGNVPDGVSLEGQMQYAPYVVSFQGDLANKALDQIVIAKLYSFLPSEIKDTLLTLIPSGDGGEGGGEGGGENPRRRFRTGSPPSSTWIS